MKLATLKDGTPDGLLVLISKDGAHFSKTPYRSLQSALDEWNAAEAVLESIAEFPEKLDLELVAAPLPRAWQWLDGSAFNSHGELMQVVFGLDPIDSDRPLMYQGLSNQFLSPTEDACFPSVEDGIDFEGEFGVIVDEVPMGVTPEEALKHIRLIVQINDWSLRRLAPIEMKTGFGWVQAKPACSMAPFAVTPDELGPGWQNGRACLDLEVGWNGQGFGRANGAQMSFGFHDLVSHAAYSRTLAAGTVIGSGTVSNSNFREVGSSCIAERRAIEMLDLGEARTPFMAFGDKVRMECRSTDGAVLFGAIEQSVAQA